MDEKHNRVFYHTTDPETDMPALTTFLYRVCEQDPAKFEEATRLIGLFLDEKEASPRPEGGRKLAFNPDVMPVRDVKDAAKTLRGILQDFDRFNTEDDTWDHQDLENFACRILQIRTHWDID